MISSAPRAPAGALSTTPAHTVGTGSTWKPREKQQILNLYFYLPNSLLLLAVPPPQESTEALKPSLKPGIRSLAENSRFPRSRAPPQTPKAPDLHPEELFQQL